MQSLLLCVTYFKDEDATIYPEELQRHRARDQRLGKYMILNGIYARGAFTVLIEKALTFTVKGTDE